MTDTADTPTAVLPHLLRAASVAVVGATDNPVKAAGRTLRYLTMHGYRGRVYPVNPRRDEVLGLRCWPSLAALPEVPELAVVVLPAAAVAAAVRECGAAGVKVAIVYSSGFAEMGPEGEALQAELSAAVAESGIRVLGPNTNGVIGAADRLTATFMSGIDDADLELRDDGVAFVTQSGAMGGFIMRQAQLSGLGIGTFVATGNEMDLSLAELVEELADDPSTRAVLAYIEGVREPERLRAALARCREREVPVAMMKVGRSAVGAAAAASHTGALAGADVVFSGMLRQHGVARAEDIDHLLDLGRVFALVPRPAGRRLGVVTLSGGAGVLVADTAATHGIELPRWDDEWAARMQAVLPAFASVRNPIDTTGALVSDPTLLRGALAVMGEHPDTDVILVVVGNMQQQEAEVCDIIAEAARATDKPIVTVWVGGSGRVPGQLAERGLAAFTEPVRAVRAIAALMDVADLPRLAPAPAGAHGAVEGPDGPGGSERPPILDEVAAKAILGRHGLRGVPERAVSTAEDAADAGDALGYPVVLKVLSTEVAHKSELGMVRVGLGSRDELHACATELLASALAHGLTDRRLVVQAMVRSDTELILGMRRDETFGPVVMLGVGGVLTEVIEDVQVRLPPLTRDDALSMMADLSFSALLDGPRGRVPVDREAVADAVLALARAVAAEGSQWDSVEVNPLLIDAEGRPVAVDALVVRSASASAPASSIGEVRPTETGP